MAFDDAFVVISVALLVDAGGSGSANVQTRSTPGPLLNKGRITPGRHTLANTSKIENMPPFNSGNPREPSCASFENHRTQLEGALTIETVG
jgi:hypothetical protein